MSDVWHEFCLAKNDFGRSIQPTEFLRVREERFLYNKFWKIPIQLESELQDPSMFFLHKFFKVSLQRSVFLT